MNKQLPRPKGDEKEVYLNKYIEKLKGAKTLLDKQLIIDKIYSDGFEDGYNEGIQEN
jgi:hypothetical protein